MKSKFGALLIGYGSIFNTYAPDYSRFVLILRGQICQIKNGPVWCLQDLILSRFFGFFNFYLKNWTKFQFFRELKVENFCSGQWHFLVTSDILPFATSKYWIFSGKIMQIFQKFFRRSLNFLKQIFNNFRSNSQINYG